MKDNLQGIKKEHYWEKNAFTLAEVLITLGIIGVVAAMTMPTLINSTKAAQFRTGYKKVLNVISQAVVVNLALEDYDTNIGNTETNKDSVYSIIKNRTNVVRTDNSSDWTSGTAKPTESDYILNFNDGMTFYFNKSL